MKKYLIFLCVAGCCILNSCTNQTQYKEVDGRKVREINESSVGFGFDSIEYVEFDGHEYVLLQSGHGISLCHSPKCKCLNNH